MTKRIPSRRAPPAAQLFRHRETEGDHGIVELRDQNETQPHLAPGGLSGFVHVEGERIGLRKKQARHQTEDVISLEHPQGVGYLVAMFERSGGRAQSRIAHLGSAR